MTFYYHKFTRKEQLLNIKVILRSVEDPVEVLVGGLQVKAKLSGLVIIEVITGLDERCWNDESSVLDKPAYCSGCPASRRSYSSHSSWAAEGSVCPGSR